ncbi:hypothetical protein [Roseibium sp. RKSG952]|uniref:hypothetical protein n=1 Tax=Roseibium sp. RKSG952 TaxID=2529384 RepID=UPI0012BD0B89|nr:hypothetical protein [Roseibium sp. RKSG952]MTH95321.1 hypothetical protein [Roseibium sp. RKSG952]
MVSHPDRALNKVLRDLSRVETNVGKITLQEGKGTTSTVAHVVYEQAATLEVPGFSIDDHFLKDLTGPIASKGGEARIVIRIELYFSASGVSLLHLAEKLTLDRGTNVIILAEIRDRGSRDWLSGQVFRVLRRSDYSMSRYHSDTIDLAPLLARVLNVTRSDYRDMIESAFEGSWFEFFNVQQGISEALIWTIDALQPLVDAFAKILNDGTMPRELWDNDLSTPDFQDLLEDLGQRLDNATAWVLDAIGGLPRLALVEEIRDWGVADLIPETIKLIQWAQDAWNATLDTLTEITWFIRRNMPSGKDILSTVIGFFCGLWDGVIQAAAGVIETVSLAMTLAKASMRAQSSPALAAQTVAEAFDEMVQILSRIDWLKLWHVLRDEIYPALKDVLNAAAEALPDKLSKSPSTAGYYTGFIVYNIVEIFFPPLKITKAARAGRVASEAAGFSGKLVAG